MQFNFVLACLFDLGFRHEGSVYDHIVLTPKYIGKVWCRANSSHSQFSMLLNPWIFLNFEIV